MPRLHIAPAFVVCGIALATIVVNSKVYRYAGRPEEARGVVGYVDDDSQKLLVIVTELEEKQWKTFEVLEETKIVYEDPESGDRDVIGLEQIGPGDDVKLVFKKQDGRFIAKRIWVSPGQPEPEGTW
jgi:hypothetical protein